MDNRAAGSMSFLQTYGVTHSFDESKFDLNVTMLRQEDEMHGVESWNTCQQDAANKYVCGYVTERRQEGAC